METELTSAGPFDPSELALNQYSLLTSNLSGKVRQESLDGRDFLVAPLSMIVPGVLSGSKGPLYYPLSEISRNADAWNGIPIVKNHPQNKDGSPCSARSPKVLEQVGMGTVFNAQVNGKLIAEGWFDVEKTKRISPSTYNKLVRGEVEELSTGLFTDNEPVKNIEDAKFNGRSYTHIARNYRPDHLAILPDKKGACSADDGCGVNVNESTEDLASNEELEPFMDFEETGPQQWYELVSNEEGCGKRCKCKDCKKKNKGDQPSEDAYSGNSSTNNQLTLNRRLNVKKTEMIAELIANCSCWEKEDEAALNAMPEAKLKSFFDHHMEHQQAQELIDNMDEEEDEEEETPPPKKGKGKMPPQFAKNEEIELVAPSVENARQRLTPQELADIQWARSERERITNELIEQITSNENNPFTDEYLKSRSREELQGLAKLASVTAKPTQNTQTPSRMQVLNFGGVAPGYVKNLGEDFSHQDQDMIPEPIDWSSN